MLFKRRPRARPDPSKFPAAQLSLLALCRISEPIALTSLLPYAWKLVLHFGIDQTQATFYTGILISAFSLAEACSGVLWGHLSDRIGRKPVLLLGCAGTGLSLLLMGFAQTFWLALLARILGGILNGSVASCQTIVNELTVNPKHEPRAYAIMPLTWTIGTAIGPSLGAFLANPAVNYPAYFPPGSLCARFPYLLPNVVCAFLMLVSIVIAYLFLDETHPDMQSWDETVDSHHADVTTSLIQASAAAPAVDLAHDDSYGTFGTVTFEDEDKKDCARDSSTRKVYTHRVVMLTVALAIFTYHSMTFDVLLPLLCEDDRSAAIDMMASAGRLSGGLGFSTPATGFILSVNGMIALVVQAFVFPIAASKLGIWRLTVLLIVAHPIAYFVMPFLVVLPSNLVLTGLYTCLTLRSLLSILLYPLLLILIKEAAPSPSCLGRINGLAASAGAASRTLAAPIAGALYGLGSQIELTAIAWWFSAAIALVGTIQLFCCIGQSRMASAHLIIHDAASVMGDEDAVLFKDAVCVYVREETGPRRSSMG